MIASARGWVIGVVLLALVMTAGAVMPTVSNVQAIQRGDGSQLVNISYTLAASHPCLVSIRISSDDGATWEVPAQTFLAGSAHGAGISGGDRQIVWDAGADWGNQWSDQMRAQVKATIMGEMVFVQGGSIWGLTVSSFQIGRHEVTWGEWKAVRAEATARSYDIGSRGAGCADDHPVHSVNWYDVVKWCNLRSEVEGRTPVYTVDGSTYKSGQRDNVAVNMAANGYRLPTSDEWGFAARGGIHSQLYIYSGSNDLDAVGWYVDNSSGAACDYDNQGRGTWPVGAKAANELGIHDMSGNVWEWCFDWSTHAVTRVGRGGSWCFSARSCEVLGIYNSYPDRDESYIGFRTALSPGQQ